MSDAAAEHSLDIREQIVRIDRALAERELMAEAAKFERERSLAPVVIAASLGAGISAGLISLLGRFIH